MKSSAILISLFLVILADGALFVQVANANFGPNQVPPPKIKIYSPENNSVCRGEISVCFNVSYFHCYWGARVSLQLSYTINDGPQIPVSLIPSYGDADTEYTTVAKSFSLKTDGLTNGVNQLVISGKIGDTNGYGGNLGGAVGVSDTLCFGVDNEAPEIAVFSPRNMTYNTSSIQLQYYMSEKCSWAGYCLDNGENVTTTSGTNVTALNDGTHTLLLYVNDTAGNMGISEVTFTVDSVAPKITIASPEDKAYNTSTIPLQFSIDEVTSCAFYSIDNQDKIITYGNTTIIGLSDGLHTVVVYANDTAGNEGKSNTVLFTVDTQPTPSPSPSASPSPSTSPSASPSATSLPSASASFTTQPTGSLEEKSDFPVLMAIAIGAAIATVCVVFAVLFLRQRRA